MRITYFLRDNGACGFYRADLPMITMKNKKAAELMKIENGEKLDKIEASLNADVFMIPRPSETRIMHSLLESMPSQKPIVIDYDDDMFNIHYLSPHYEDYGTENVTVNYFGQERILWEDGKKGFSLARNRNRLAEVKECCRRASMITVTTPLLAEAFKPYNGNVVALPNCLKMSMWKKLPLRSHEPEIRMLWTGGSSHYEDWCLLAEVLPLVMRKHRNLKLVIGGQKFDGTLKNCPLDQIEFKEWTDIKAHHLQCAIFDADFCIIPLVDNEFNRRKSAIKWLEMAALQVPCVMSHVSPYSEVYNGENAMMIENNSQAAWVEGLETMIEDRLLRAKIGQAAYESAKKDFDIEDQYMQWVKAYKGVIDGN